MEEAAESHHLSASMNESSLEESTPQLLRLEISGVKIRTKEGEVHSTPEQEEQEDKNADLSPLEEDPSARTLAHEISSDSNDQPRSAGSAGASVSRDTSIGSSVSEEGSSTADIGHNRRASEAARKTGENGGEDTPGPKTTPNTASGASEQENEIKPAPNTKEVQIIASEIKVVVAGKSGAGKSELTNNLLKKNKVIEPSPKSITNKLKLQHTSRNGVKIYIIDTPGLKMDAKEKKKQLKELSEFTKGSADLLVYCIPVGPSNKFSDDNLSIMKTLQSTFGVRVWDNCVVVFTFSNLAWNKIHADHDQEDDANAKYKAYIQTYAKEFEEELKKLKVPNVNVGTVFDLPSPPRANNGINIIPGVPAGYKADDRVLVDLITDESWTETVFLEMLEKCNGKHKMALLQYYYGRELVMKAFRSRYGVVLMGSSGGGALIVGAATVGSIVGLGAGPVGMVIGGTIGAAVGIVASTVLSGGIAADSSGDSTAKKGDNIAADKNGDIAANKSTDKQ